ncbi:DUF1538 domain-containing protein [Roseicella aerolata]|uniref:DUF1538 domain-containing protein n=1 Tax=Roseicella aerolata TaxID=2883479 RepID=A0A9X1LDU6_9PROT|nr:DUF1538 domain-containing protein [Roseicella aerolata]MCB4825337.1 DUF1538 domain-containing protein [Roseicella aerolata]
MPAFAHDLLHALLATLLDAAPVALVVGVFQAFVLCRRPPQLPRVLIGVAYVVLGLALFRLGLEWSLLPIGADLSERLTAPSLAASPDGEVVWHRFLWLYLFAASLGFATTMVEPALTAIADRVGTLTGGTLRPLALRLAVAAGVSLGLLLGTLRIVAGLPLPWAVAGLVGLIAALVAIAPRQVVPLAFDCGGFATSVVTVPMVAAFAVGVATVIPGRDPLTDGFGVILFALLSPVASVLAYAAALERGPRDRGPGGTDAVQATTRSG